MANWKGKLARLRQLKWLQKNKGWVTEKGAKTKLTVVEVCPLLLFQRLTQNTIRSTKW